MNVGCNSRHNTSEGKSSHADQSYHDGAINEFDDVLKQLKKPEVRTPFLQNTSGGLLLLFSEISLKK